MNPTSQLTFKPNETSCAVINSFTTQVNNSMGVVQIDYFPGSTSAVSENYEATLNEINGKWLIAGLSFTPNGSGGYSYFNFVLVQQ
jgi:hypothetical protein